MMKVNKLTIEEILKKHSEGFYFDINNGQITNIYVTGISTVSTRNK